MLDEPVEIVRVEENAPTDSDARYSSFCSEPPDVALAKAGVAAGCPNCHQGPSRTLLLLRAGAHKRTPAGAPSAAVVTAAGIRLAQRRWASWAV